MIHYKRIKEIEAGQKRHSPLTNQVLKAVIAK
jgi:hypothetical protein